MSQLRIPRPQTIEDYAKLDRWLKSTKARSEDLWVEAMRWLCREDLYYLTTRVCSTRGAKNNKTGQSVFERPFILARCRDLESQESGVTDVWGRGMGKSTLKTKHRNIQRILNDKESTGCIFSYQRKAAKKHLRSIKLELEQNSLLKFLFPDVLYVDPKTQSDSWSLEDGLRVKRLSARIEASFEAHGFMDGLPTGSHFDRIDFDDVEDDKSVGSEEMIEKMLFTFSQSLNLKSQNFELCPTGTFYHHQGLMATLVKKTIQSGGEVQGAKESDWMKVAMVAAAMRGEDVDVSYRGKVWHTVRLYPGEDLTRPGKGPLGGSPSYYSLEELWAWWEQIDDPIVYAMQIACDLTAGHTRRLDPDQIITYTRSPMEEAEDRPIYICVDPSLGVKDPTAILAFANAPDKRHRVIDAFRQKVAPSELAKVCLDMANKWNQVGEVIEIRVEDVGQAHYSNTIRDHLEAHGCFTPVTRCPNVSRSDKTTRIWGRWEPALRHGKVLAPLTLPIEDDNGKVFCAIGFLKSFELNEFPRPSSDHFMDAGGLLWDPDKNLPPLVYELSVVPDEDEADWGSADGNSFMACGWL